jgi:3-methyladenine DNA glycosylase AlkD
MNKTQVLALLKENRNERGIANWKKGGHGDGGLESFGIGLTVLRKLARQVGRDRALARKLWQTDVYDAKVLGLLIDDPKQLTREQAEEQVEKLDGGMLAHVFSSCDATLAKAPIAFELACDWIESRDEMRKRCGWGLLYELSKKNPEGMDDAFLLECIDRVGKQIDGEPTWVRMAMAGALVGIGKRNKKLNRAAVRVAKQVGPIDFNDGSGRRCDPFDPHKHLTSEHLKKKLG